MKTTESNPHPAEEESDIKEYTEDKIEDIMDITSKDLDIQIEEMIEKNEGLWKCKVCAKATTGKDQIKVHAETHIGGMSHACNLCGKTFPNRPGLRSHISSIHSVLFSCELCVKSGMNRATYRMHKQRNHK